MGKIMFVASVELLVPSPSSEQYFSCVCSSAEFSNAFISLFIPKHFWKSYESVEAGFMALCARVTPSRPLTGDLCLSAAVGEPAAQTEEAFESRPSDASGNAGDLDVCGRLTARVKDRRPAR